MIKDEILEVIKKQLEILLHNQKIDREIQAKYRIELEKITSKILARQQLIDPVIKYIDQINHLRLELKDNK